MKLAIGLALKAKRAWDRLPPEQRARLLESAKTTVRTQGPVVAKKAATTARTHGPALAKKAADTAKAHAPGVARRIGEAIERARKGLQ
jgi:acyl-CoA reductase-like NAD-dependent aldehyde dehydrogenase